LKISYLVLPFALAAALLGACGTNQTVKELEETDQKIEVAEQEPAEKETKVIEPQENETKQDLEGISFNIPNTIESLPVSEEIEFPTLSYKMPMSDGGIAGFSVVIEDLSQSENPEVPLEDYVKIGAELNGFTYDKNEDVEYNGYMAKRTEYLKQEGIRLQQFTFIENRKAYIFSYAYIDGDNFGLGLPTVEKILNTVSFN
jgi:hypothetical protein